MKMQKLSLLQPKHLPQSAALIEEHLLLAGSVIADDPLIQTHGDKQQLVSGREAQPAGWSLVSAFEGVLGFLSVGVPQNHCATVRHTAHQGLLHRRVSQILDRLHNTTT